jgi:uncharacterized protein DUF6518
MVVSKRILPCLLVAAAFGVAAGLFKGDDSGLRGGIGNLSAPWLLVAFLPALGARTIARGAVVGFVSTVVALIGFYGSLTVVLAGHLGGHGYLPELLVELRANHLYFLAGVLTGPVLGAAGAWVGRHRRRWAAFLTGSLLAGEVVVVAVVQGRQLLPAPVYFRWGVDDWTPYLGESALGIAVVLVTLWISRDQAAAAQRPG